MKRLCSVLLVIILLLNSAAGLVSCAENTVTVRFVVDGELYASVEVNGEEEPSLPTAPEKEGCVFGGWYFDDGVWENSFGEEQLRSEELSEGVTVYAKWTDAHIHTPSDWVIDTEATCKDPGRKHTECTECGEAVEYAVIEKSEAHVEVVDPRVEPTETEDGLTEGSHCSVCGKILVEQTVISAKLQGVEIASSALTVSGAVISGSRGNSTESFSFMNDIDVAPNASYIVAYDSGFTSVIEDKVAALEVGDNVFYILVTNGAVSKSYTVTIRRLPTYTVSFATAGGSAVRAQTVEEGALATEPTTTRTGYTFKSWNFDFSTPITADLTVEASWVANTNTPYRVEYYLENVYKTGYEYPLVENFTATTGATVVAEQRKFEHFRINEALSVTDGSVRADGSLVLKVYYLRDTYAVSAVANDATWGEVSGAGSYAYGKEITLKATDRQGYVFLGWFEGDFTVSREAEFTFKVEKPVSYTAKWTEATNTPYTVEYYLENLKKTGYDEPIIEALAGKTNAPVVATQRSFEHFTYLDTAENVLDGQIKPDGTLVLRVYYTRDTYDIGTGVNDSDRGTVEGSGSYVYGEEVTLTATDKRGFSFLGFYDENGNPAAQESELIREGDTYPYTYVWSFSAEKNVRYVAKWGLATDTRYTVEYYFETVDKNGYPTLPGQTEIRTGTTFDEVTLEPRGFDHFTFVNAASNILSGTIAPDGNLVLKVYYTRNTYDVSMSVDDAKHGTVEGAGTYAYEAEITLIARNKQGYVFVGWYVGEKKVCEQAEYTFSAIGNVSCVAKWGPATDTPYRVEYYLENVAKNDYALQETTELTGTTDSEVNALRKAFAHFTFNEAASVMRGDVAPDGGLVLRVYYTRDTYSLSNENEELGRIEGSQSFAYNSENTVTAHPRLGCQFIGWYSGTVALSTELEYTFHAEQDVVARFMVDPFMEANFIFTSDENECIIEDVINKDLTQIAVPGYVTGIREGAFSGCAALQSITLPFIGGDSSATTLSERTVFGYIFGKNSYEGAEAISQKYKEGNVADPFVTYYVPSSLTSVTVTGGRIGPCSFSHCRTIESVTITGEAESVRSYAFEYCENLKTLSIPDSVTEIHEGAFYECSSLENLNIGSSVTYIGNYAFNKCTSLTELTIPSGVTRVGAGAFLECTGLKRVVIPDHVEAVEVKAFEGCTGLEEAVIGSKLEEIPEDMFKNCTSLTTVSIGESAQLKSIGRTAFQNCTSLKTVDVGNGITLISDYAFQGCINLEELNVGEGVLSIFDGAFQYCENLKSVTLSKDLYHLGSKAFDGCTSIERVNISSIEMWLSLDLEAFPESNPLYCGNGTLYIGGQPVTEVVIPETVTEIGVNAFAGCQGLKKVVIHENVTSIGSGAFENCRSLETVEFSADSKLRSLNAYAFLNCTALKNVTIPEGITVLNSNVFENCSSLKELVLHEGLTKIGAEALKGCSSLERISFPASLTTIGNNALEGCSGLTSLTVPSTVMEIGKDAFVNCSGIQTVVIEQGGVTALHEGLFSGCSAIESMELPFVGLSQTATGESALFGIIFGGDEYEGGVATKQKYGIEYTFYFPKNLRSVTVNGANTADTNKKQIYERAFSGCASLQTITLPADLTTIGYYAFYGCTALQTITLPESVTSIGQYAFSNCSALASVVIPKSVTKVEKGAFTECKKLIEIINKTEQYDIPSNAYNSSTTTVHKGSTLLQQTEDGYIFYSADGVTYLYAYVGDQRTITLPETYEGKAYAIYQLAFAYNKSLVSVTIPGSVTSIGEWAFYGCTSLEAVTIGNGIETLAIGVFSNCTSLKSFVVPDTVTVIKDSVFLGCTDLVSLTFSAKVTEVGNDVIRNCPSLTTVYYKGTEAQWGEFDYAWRFGSQTVEFIG